MLKAEQVPKEAADALQELISRGVFTSTEEAIAAAINAWPGFNETKMPDWPWPKTHVVSYPAIILPLLVGPRNE